MLESPGRTLNISIISLRKSKKEEESKPSSKKRGRDKQAVHLDETLKQENCTNSAKARGVLFMNKRVGHTSTNDSCVSSQFSMCISNQLEYETLIKDLKRKKEYRQNILYYYSNLLLCFLFLEPARFPL